MPEKIVKVKDRKTNAIVETESIPMKKWLWHMFKTFDTKNFNEWIQKWEIDNKPEWMKFYEDQLK